MALCTALIEQLQEFETPLIAEALGALGCPHPDHYYMGSDIKLLCAGALPLVGVALAVESDTSSPNREPDPDGLRAIMGEVDNSLLPVVVVAKTVGARPLHECVIGDGMAKALQAAGSTGFITNGGVRDLDRMDRIGYTVYGTGTVANHATFAHHLASDPVQMSGISIPTGALLHADADGVLIIPSEYHCAIVEAAILSRDFETRAHTYGRRSDKSIDEKRRFVADLDSVRTTKCKALLDRRPDA